MAPHKSKARAHQPQPPPQPSDYETDAPPPAVDVPLPPPRSNEELNHSVLRRIYPELVAIEHVTPYAALYTFARETEQWEKVGVEGTLFLCRLAPSPIGADRYSVAILNRRGLENFYVELTSEEEIEFSDPYVILQESDQIYGVWVFADPPPASTADCRTDTANKIMQSAEKARLSRESKEQEAHNGAQQAFEDIQTPVAAPMGRQLSLRELFGQQLQQDAAPSIHSQHGQQIPQHYTQQQAYPPAQNPGMSQQDVLEEVEITVLAPKNISTKQFVKTPKPVVPCVPDPAILFKTTPPFPSKKKLPLPEHDFLNESTSPGCISTLDTSSKGEQAPSGDEGHLNSDSRAQSKTRYTSMLRGFSAYMLAFMDTVNGICGHPLQKMGAFLWPGV
ncbi:hypothetical protein E8E13_007829 [Curvularia kusanoi]|uniref:PH domain-like protein n=1 Tax=Curvularia kusanoi TaxID=90978 RepID=A0A9P4WAD0_CURKU|nr:hypothetical protein E8E13_007829 [Curvularia kusanoi]